MNDQEKMIPSDGHHDAVGHAVGNGYHVSSTSRDNDDAKISSSGTTTNSNDIPDSNLLHSSDVLQSASGSEKYVYKKIEAPTSKILHLLIITRVVVKQIYNIIIILMISILIIIILIYPPQMVLI